MDWHRENRGGANKCIASPVGTKYHNLTGVNWGIDGQSCSVRAQQRAQQQNLNTQAIP
jgi:hypothetical protein